MDKLGGYKIKEKEIQKISTVIDELSHNEFVKNQLKILTKLMPSSFP